MRTPLQGAGLGAWSDAVAGDSDATTEATNPSERPPNPPRAEDMTDRPLNYPHGFRGAHGAQESPPNPARTRWLEEHDVHTEFLDAGIGCCWLAEEGDHGAVMGETEDGAIAQLARVKGWDLWDGA